MMYDSGSCEYDATGSLCISGLFSSEQFFTGKERDTESGNDYFGARYYASTMGRFMSPDQLPWIHYQHGNESDQKKFVAFLANPQNFNMYAYVNNNPQNKTDPTGMNACGTNDDSNCKVTVTIQDRSKDASGHYNDQYTGVKNSGNYNATAVVSVNGKEAGTFLVKTTLSDSSKSATIANGTYSGTLTEHNRQLAIRLQPTNAIPTIGPNPSRSDGASIAQGILVHQSGLGNFTGVGRDGRAVSEGSQVVCRSQYADFMNPQTLNLYASVGNDPVNGVDQDGHFSWAGNGCGSSDTQCSLPEFDMSMPHQEYEMLQEQNVAASQKLKANEVSVVVHGDLPPSPPINQLALSEILRHYLQRNRTAPNNAVALVKKFYSCQWDAVTSNGNGVSLLLDAAGFFPGESQIAAGAQVLVGSASIVNSVVHSDGRGTGLGSTGYVLTVAGAATKGMGLSAAKAIPVAGYFVNGIATARDLWNTWGDVGKCMSHPYHP